MHEALYRYDVSWDAFSDSSDIYFLFAEDLEFFKYSAPIETTFFVTYFSATIYHRLLIFCMKLYIGMMYCGMHFQIHRTSTFCLPRTFSYIVPIYNIFRNIILSNYVSQATDILHEVLYRYDVS